MGADVEAGKKKEGWLLKILSKTTPYLSDIVKATITGFGGHRVADFILHKLHDLLPPNLCTQNYAMLSTLGNLVNLLIIPGFTSLYLNIPLSFTLPLYHGFERLMHPAVAGFLAGVGGKAIQALSEKVVDKTTANEIAKAMLLGVAGSLGLNPWIMVGAYAIDTAVESYKNGQLAKTLEQAKGWAKNILRRDRDEQKNQGDLPDHLLNYLLNFLAPAGAAYTVASLLGAPYLVLPFYIVGKKAFEWSRKGEGPGQKIVKYGTMGLGLSALSYFGTVGSWAGVFLSAIIDAYRYAKEKGTILSRDYLKRLGFGALAFMSGYQSVPPTLYPLLATVATSATGYLLRNGEEGNEANSNPQAQ